MLDAPHLKLPIYLMAAKVTVLTVLEQREPGECAMKRPERYAVPPGTTLFYRMARQVKQLADLLLALVLVSLDRHYTSEQ